mgnify:FL=1
MLFRSIGLTLFLLKKYKEGQPAGQIANPSPLGKFEWRYLWFLGVPFLAIFVFFWFFAATIIIQTSILYLVILMPAGFFFYGKGGYEIMKKARGMTSSTFVNAPSK